MMEIVFAQRVNLFYLQQRTKIILSGEETQRTMKSHDVIHEAGGSRDKGGSRPFVLHLHILLQVRHQPANKTASNQKEQNENQH